MANIKSAKKRIEVAKYRTELNKGKKTEIKSYVKKFDQAIESGNIEEAKELIKMIDKKLKRATHHNILHKNASSRKLSHLTKKLNKAI
ncbi:30S ribosomal protein S20 [Tissierella creatinophila]|uniref:Small ribosomal subunit protein bS20 n=1 Tax=Tissierella creatinophila DSM 6911 TaxID=1123403 RepID=A0A1U7M7Y6_TISCR|nr:30S ribosomal protein S20 [Tissierella creatinophila]OLS03396.1 30S ribosomal protein S20 [Tissierella creatinophila DSM 6911]